MRFSTNFLSFILIVFAVRASSAQSGGLAAAQALPSTNSFAKRANLYGQDYRAIQAAGIDSGFTGAAADVTLVLSIGMGYQDISDHSLLPKVVNFRSSTKAFLPRLSQGLAQLNAPLIVKLLQSGSLGSGLDNGPAIDAWWVQREQKTAEGYLNALPSDQRQIVVDDMNASLWQTETASNIASYLGISDYQCASIRAANVARIILEATENRDPDYGNLDDRILIGKMTCALNRKNDRIVAVCKHTETLMDVQAGDHLVFSVQGQVKTGANIVPCGPEGGNYQPLLAPPVRAAFGALIAKIGSGASAKYFLVNDGKTLTAPSSGTLRVFVNNGLPFNDTGAFVVSVSRTSG